MPTMSWTGLAAETWDALGGDEPQHDLEFFGALVERQGGPALDVGCGTGRLLVRFLRAGLVVHGVDTSADMLALCRAKAHRAGVEPALFRQATKKRIEQYADMWAFLVEALGMETPEL